MSNNEAKVVTTSNNKIINNEIISEEQKQKLVEKIITKWLNLQKIIKEEITLEDVIIKQQQDDTDNLKSFFVKYYQAKLNTRKIWNDINKLKLYEKESNILSIIISEELGASFHDASEPIKNLFFIIRNNYDYLTRILSLIKPEDFMHNINKIYSLVELLNNNFYENILIPNPEQLELLILIYKLLEEEITSMNSVCPENFLEENSFTGIFLSSFAKKQEIIGYFSMILNPLIVSIDDDDSKDFLDLNINNIMSHMNNSLGKRKSIIKMPSIEKKINLDINIKEYLFDKIPKTKIKFKNSFKLEAEKEKEDEITFITNDDYTTDSEKNTIYINKKRKSILQKNILTFGKENEYNRDYKYDLNQSRLIDKIDKESNPEMKNIYMNILEELNFYPNKFSNEGILKILKTENEKKGTLLEVYKENFIYIREIIEELLQVIIDKIITMPYPLRCISKFISILISKKFPDLTKYEINSFIGKFIFDKCIFSILSLENKYYIDSRVYNKKTKTCLEIVISVLSKANNSSLFDNYSDPEKTIFNPLILEIIPILNEFYEKIIDIQLPNGVEQLINKATIHLKDLSSRNLFNFRYKKRKSSSKAQSEQNIEENLQSQTPLFDYFKENPDEILHLQSVCFSADDIKFLLDLIERNMGLFKDLPRFNFFSKTYTKIKNEEKTLNLLLEKDLQEKNKTFYVIFKEEKNNILEKLSKKKKKDSTFESSEQDSQLVCRRVKFCIKTILKGLNLLNSKDFAYLNFAQSTDKFFSAIKYTLEELGEYNELSNNIPLNWYSQYIYNYKKELDIEYQKEDFSKLYSEISSEENNILNELKSLSNIIITRDGMNLRCAEKILAKAIYELKRIEEAKKYNQLEKFIKTRKIEVCVYQPDDSVKSKNKDKDLLINIFDLKSCPFGNSFNDNKNHIHINSINDFIKIFSSNNKIKLKSYIREAIIKGENKYNISEIIGKYMELVAKKIRENKTIFGELNDEKLEEFSKNIENHIIRKIYKYVYPPNKSEIDLKIQNDTRTLGWIQPENLDIKKLYVNQLKSAEKYISKMNESKSVFDKLECIQNAFVIMNNTIKFISGKNENAGQDELTPLFQYIIIKSQPERLHTNINYIKCFLSSTDLISKYGFFVSQMESACTYILNIKGSDFKMDNEEFNKLREQYAKNIEDKDFKNKDINKINIIPN